MQESGQHRVVPREHEGNAPCTATKEVKAHLYHVAYLKHTIKDCKMEKKVIIPPKK